MKKDDWLYRTGFLYGMKYVAKEVAVLMKWKVASMSLEEAWELFDKVIPTDRTGIDKGFLEYFEHEEADLVLQGASDGGIVLKNTIIAEMLDCFEVFHGECMTWMIANAIDGCSLEDIADFSTKQLLDMAGWFRGMDLEKLKDDFLATRQNTEGGIKGVLDMVCNQMEK